MDGEKRLLGIEVAKAVLDVFIESAGSAF